MRTRRKVNNKHGVEARGRKCSNNQLAETQSRAFGSEMQSVYFRDTRHVDVFIRRNVSKLSSTSPVAFTRDVWVFTNRNSGNEAGREDGDRQAVTSSLSDKVLTGANWDALLP